MARPDFDLYDHAFALFGLAAAARRGHDSTPLAEMAVRIRDARIARHKYQSA